MANYSGGKDSEAMVRELIRRKYPLDEVVAFDGGWEFYCVQRNWENMRAFVESKGIKFKILRPECSFQSLMLKLNAENAALRENRIKAVKDVAERIKTAFYCEFEELIPSIMADKIDEIVKEVLK
jgi:hypothetical protein